MQLPDVLADSGPLDRTRVIHHRTVELLTKRYSVFDVQAVSLVEEGAKHTQSLSCLLPHLVYVSRPGKLCIKSQPKITSCFDPSYWLSEELHWSGFWMHFAVLTNSTTVLLETLMPIVQFRSQCCSLPA
jgi:hypothetical protein